MSRKALGRGLEMLIPQAKVPEEPQAGVRQIALDQIAANPFQPRQAFSPEELQELADSIRVHGVLQPVVVRPTETGYECVVGERRLRASRAAGLSEIPALLKDCSDQQMLELAVIENAQREDLSPLESAAAYSRLVVEFGMTQEQVASALGKSRSSVANTIRLLDLPDPIREALAAGEITEGHARALLTAGDDEAMLALWDRIAGSELSVRQVESLARELRQSSSERETTLSRPRIRTDQPDPNVSALLERIQRRIGTKVQLKPGKNGGTILIEYYSEEDFDRISDLLLGSNETLID